MKNTINFKKPKVLFFDINETILDLNLLRTEINNLFGQDIFDLWFAKLLHKSLMFTITGNFESFTQMAYLCLLSFDLQFVAQIQCMENNKQE